MDGQFPTFPVLLVDKEIDADNASGEATRAIVAELEELGHLVERAKSDADALLRIQSGEAHSCLIQHWEGGGKEGAGPESAARVIDAMRRRSLSVPIFLFTDHTSLETVPVNVLREVNEYIWQLEDTPSFIAGRVDFAIHEYVSDILPPFFKALSEFATHHEYSWHTPGHAGGIGFLKTPAGRAFFHFFGENLFRSDLSVSVGELGSLLDHSGPVGDAEKYAARVFGADRTYFVTNGSSTSNKIILQSAVTVGDIVAVDRNCHKSLCHAFTITGAMPVYMVPSRNGYGIIGPIHASELEPETLAQKIKDSPLVKDNPNTKPAMAVVTNSTYDGLCYDVKHVAERLGESTDRLHFDEAWFAYARFNPMYRGRLGMHDGLAEGHPTIYTTHSTHKLLAALSQASMIHVKTGRAPFEHDRFNEAFMMHSSTSPQYAIIASTDVSARMMDGATGRDVTDLTIREAISFRKTITRVSREMETPGGAGTPERQWGFKAWQPDTVADPSTGERVDFVDASRELLHHPDSWVLEPEAEWHGFGKMPKGYCMLDPIKVTLLTPGVDVHGKCADWGIPAALVSMFLGHRGIVVEKTGDYCFLLLFSLGITRGKWGTLLTELLEFKRLYDTNATLHEAIPELVKAHPVRYRGMTLRQLADEMHEAMKANQQVELLEAAFDGLPEVVMAPDEAYRNLVKGKVEKIPVDEMLGRTAGVMVVPYPPGIPVLMPGEKASGKAKAVVEYLQALQKFDLKFPGFSHDVHGVEMEEGRYVTYCVVETPT